MNFTEFQETMIDNGATALDRGNGHWQVKVGTVTLNYYPTSARKTLFVNPIEGVTKTMRFEKADINTVLKLVKDFKQGVTNGDEGRSSHDTEERVEDSQ